MLIILSFNLPIWARHNPGRIAPRRPSRPPVNMPRCASVSSLGLSQAPRAEDCAPGCLLSRRVLRGSPLSRDASLAARAAPSCLSRPTANTSAVVTNSQNTSKSYHPLVGRQITSLGRCYLGHRYELLCLTGHHLVMECLQATGHAPRAHHATQEQRALTRTFSQGLPLTKERLRKGAGD